MIVVAACLVREWSSLRAFPLVFGMFRRKWIERKIILHRRRATDGYMAGWFSNRPVSYPAPRIAAKALACLAAKR